jgi:hypothetical protein
VFAAVPIIMAIPKTIISTPITAAITILVFSWFARIVFAQTPVVPNSNEDLFYWVGRIVVVGSLAGIAAAAIYTAFRKAAYTEQKELATTRKEKISPIREGTDRYKGYVRELGIDQRKP